MHPTIEFKGRRSARQTSAIGPDDSEMIRRSEPVRYQCQQMVESGCSCWYFRRCIASAQPGGSNDGFGAGSSACRTAAFSLKETVGMMKKMRLPAVEKLNFCCDRTP